MDNGLWTVWTAEEHACPHCRQPLRRRRLVDPDRRRQGWRPGGTTDKALRMCSIGCLECLLAPLKHSLGLTIVYSGRGQ